MRQLVALLELPARGVVWLASMFLIFCILDPLIWVLEKTYGTTEDWDKDEAI